MVVIKEILAARGCEIRIALTDYHAVLSKLNVINLFALRMSELPEETTLALNLIVNESNPAISDP